MSKTKIAIAGAVAAAGIGFGLFRPDRAFTKTAVSEGLASSQGDTQLLAAGRFHGVAHNGTGLASIYQLPEGKRVLRFTEFEVLNGPSLQVYLVAAGDASDSDTVRKAGFVSLGPLKGTQGDQNYDVPADLDLSKYRAASVWCSRFGVNFATAPLSAQ